MNLRTEGGIKALLGIVRCGHPDVLSQVARGVANFAKCESRASTQGKQMCLNSIRWMSKVFCATGALWFAVAAENRTWSLV